MFSMLEKSDKCSDKSDIDFVGWLLIVISKIPCRAMRTSLVISDTFSSLFVKRLISYFPDELVKEAMVNICS